MPEFNASQAPEEGRADFPKLELQKDEIARINMISVKGWVVTVRHFVTGIGYVHCHAVDKIKLEKPEDLLPELLKIQDEGGRPDDCMLCKMVDEGNERVKAPRRQFAARVLRYKTDLKGNMSSKNINYWLEIWLFDNKKYRDIQNILKEWGGEKKTGIGNHDIMLTCNEATYQNMTIQPLKSAAWRTDVDGVTEFIKKEFGTHNLSDCLGQTIEEDALRRRFAQAQRKTQPDSPPDFPFEEKADSPPIEPVPASTEGEDMFDLGESSPKGEIPEVADKEEADDSSFLDDLLNEK
jgi:hypothetical protein